MNASYEKFTMIYNSYSAEKCERTRKTFAYRLDSVKDKKAYLKFYKIPFSVKIVFSAGCLAMKLSTDGIITDSTAYLIGSYFEKFNREKDYVYTKTPSRILDFFKEGIYFLNLQGGKTSLALNPETRKAVIKTLFASDGVTEYDEELYLSNFKFLQIMTWDSLKLKVAEDERVGKLTCMDLDMEWVNPFDGNEETASVSVESIPDGLIHCLNSKGFVDIEYIASVSKSTLKEVIMALKGSIFQDPLKWDECFYKGWETADEYLSGNIREKLTVAKRANKAYRGWFADNITALSAIAPKSVQADEIYVALGSPWLPVHIVEEFIEYLFDNVLIYTDMTYAIRHDSITGAWEIPHKRRYDGVNPVKSTVVYGTKRLNALQIIERMLNMKSVIVYDETVSYTSTSGIQRVINKPETVHAAEKQKKIKEEFASWVWSDSQRAKELEEIFRTKFLSVHKRHFDGSFLRFPGMSKNVGIYPYQKNAVARILFSPNTLLAHDVGAGKTYIMVAAAMEKKRLGLSEKNMFVVPNNLIGQWKDIYLNLYPDAKLLTVEPGNFKPADREKTLEKIRDDDYDGIIIAYSCFSMIPVSKNFFIESINDEIKKISEKTAGDRNVPGRLKSRLKELEKKRAKLEAEHENEMVFFEDLGINSLFIDEAHNFKNISIKTEINGVLGINSKGSKRCDDMLAKVHCVQKQNDGGGVVMATGTPITNSVTDAFVMQTYLQYGELQLAEFHNFDSWVGMFAEPVTQFEVDVDTNNYRMATRFSVFHNLPELTSMLSAVADFHKVDTGDSVPEAKTHDIMITKTPELGDYLKLISKRADNVRNHRIPRKEDNMLKITTDGRKAALDIKLVMPGLFYRDIDSKAKKCSEMVYEIYEKTRDMRLTQIIFCDISTPKQGFNLYDDLKYRLVKKGVPESEICFIHSADTAAKRERLFRKMRKGDIRILIGSTFKLGLGVNVQDKLVAVHHLDVPWRPADMTQREGRMLRPGNDNKTVHIYRYITEGSFDAYSWQLLDSKQKFISGLLSGSMAERSGSDIDETVLTYAQVKALAIGNPLIKKRVELSNELSKNLSLQKRFFDLREQLELELAELPGKIGELKEREAEALDDAGYSKSSEYEYSKEERRLLRETVTAAINSHFLEAKDYHVCSYRGFDIYVPANTSRNNPCVFLKRKGRYLVETGASAAGNLVRIDNFIDNLTQYYENRRQTTEAYILRMSEIQKELEKENPYADLIRSLKTEIEKIDKELEVKPE